MPKTALALIREVAKRAGDLILSTPTSAGTATTLVDTALNQYMPVDNTQFYPWVYGPTGVDASNVGLSRRGRAWTQSTSTLTLFSPGFPAALSAGTYEIHLKYERDRILEAINEAMGILDQGWYRTYVDTSITTAASTWKYTLPASQNWSQVVGVEIQMNTDTSFPTFPYASADPWNWRVYDSTDPTTGVITWVIQFGTLPPPGRTLRVWGVSGYGDLTADTDVFAVGGSIERSTLAWVYRWALHNLSDWETMKLPAGQVDEYRRKSQMLMSEAMRLRQDLGQPASNGKVAVPGRGDGTFPSSGGADPSYFGVFSSVWYS